MDDSHSQIYERLIGVAIRFVSYRPRSERELQNFLERKLTKSQTYADFTVLEKVRARMSQLGYLNDATFARWWVEQRQAFKPKGGRLIAMELLAKGVSREIISEVLPADSIQTAAMVLVKKMPSWRSYSADQQKKKAYSFLYRRGFDSQTIARVVDESFKKVVK